MRIMIECNIDFILTLLLVLLTVLFSVYLLFDVNHFLTNIFIVLWCKIRKKTVKLNEGTYYYSICTTNDIDMYFDHMNNARYMRELDFVRLHFYERTGLYRILQKSKAPAFQTASTIRYRRKIPAFALYKIHTKIVYWDEKSIYLEHQFITLKDNFITTIVLGKQTVVGLDMLKVINRLLGKEETYKPQASPELEDWIKSNEKSSARLRPKILDID